MRYPAPQPVRMFHGEINILVITCSAANSDEDLPEVQDIEKELITQPQNKDIWSLRRFDQNCLVFSLGRLPKSHLGAFGLYNRLFVPLPPSHTVRLSDY